MKVKIKSYVVNNKKVTSYEHELLNEIHESAKDFHVSSACHGSHNFLLLYFIDSIMLLM